jgi:hypothetical protein
MRWGGAELDGVGEMGFCWADRFGEYEGVMQGGEGLRFDVGWLVGLRLVGLLCLFALLVACCLLLVACCFGSADAPGLLGRVRLAVAQLPWLRRGVLQSVGIIDVALKPLSSLW